MRWLLVDRFEGVCGACDVGPYGLATGIFLHMSLNIYIGMLKDSFK